MKDISIIQQRFPTKEKKNLFPSLRDISLIHEVSRIRFSIHRFLDNK